jgi:broad specificity phosphatase PhoE
MGDGLYCFFRAHMDQRTVFFLIRHGEAFSNTNHILDSFPGNPAFGLTETGRKQVRQSAEQLALWSPDLLLSSPMRRTRETTEIISAACGGFPIRFDKRLREGDNGIWHGVSQDEFRKRYPDPVSHMNGNVEEGLEGYGEMRKRMVEVVREVLANFRSRRIAIVSHGDPLEQLHGALVGESVETSMNGWYPELGSATRVEVDDSSMAGLLSGG